MLYEMVTGKTPFSGSNPFVIMNDRLLNNPMPPREIDPGDFAGSYRRLSTGRWSATRKSRYASAREFAWDLAHQDQVGVADRAELRDWRQRRTPRTRTILFYALLALIPVAIFGLLLLVARHS